MASSSHTSDKRCKGGNERQNGDCLLSPGLRDKQPCHSACNYFLQLFHNRRILFVHHPFPIWARLVYDFRFLTIITRYFSFWTEIISQTAILSICETRCEESIKFLNELLDDYMSELPEEGFDHTERDWKYRNVDFFHLLDCMVRQQDKRAIHHIKKARDFFPENVTELNFICKKCRREFD